MVQVKWRMGGGQRNLTGRHCFTKNEIISHSIKYLSLCILWHMLILIHTFILIFSESLTINFLDMLLLNHYIYISHVSRVNKNLNIPIQL